MKYVLIFLMFSALQLSAQENPEKQNAGEKKETRQSKREKKRAARRAAEQEAIDRVNQLLETKQWVLEAVTVQGKRGGQVYNLNPNLNFVSVNTEDEAVVQLAFHHLIGWNGVGGVTVKGRITRYEFRPPKKPGKPGSLRATMIGSGGSADLFVRVSAYQCTAEVSGNWGNRITLMGEIKHPSESNVYQGMSRYGK